MKAETLKSLGLTKAQIKVYLALFELGSSLASAIARKSGVERSMTYQILSVLTRNGMVSSVIKENRKYFIAAEPERLLDILKEKEEQLAQNKNEVKSLITELKILRHSKPEALHVTVYAGLDGFKTVMNDILKEKKDYYILGYTAKSTKIAKYWYTHWNNKRVKLKLSRFLLIPPTVKRKDALKHPFTFVKELPLQYIAPSRSSTTIYGKDKVLLFLPLEKDFTGIIIQNKEIHNSYKDFFDILWMKAR